MMARYGVAARPRPRRTHTRHAAGDAL